MSDSGVLDRLSKKWWGRGAPCEDPTNFTELGFFQTATAFLILLVGLVMASLSLVTEKLLGKRLKFFKDRESKRLKVFEKRQTAEHRHENPFIFRDPKLAIKGGSLPVADT